MVVQGVMPPSSEDRTSCFESSDEATFTTEHSETDFDTDLEIPVSIRKSLASRERHELGRSWKFSKPEEEIQFFPPKPTIDDDNDGNYRCERVRGRRSVRVFRPSTSCDTTQVSVQPSMKHPIQPSTNNGNKNDHFIRTFKSVRIFRPSKLQIDADVSVKFVSTKHSTNNSNNADGRHITRRVVRRTQGTRPTTADEREVISGLVIKEQESSENKSSVSSLSQVENAFRETISTLLRGIQDLTTLPKTVEDDYDLEANYDISSMSYPSDSDVSIFEKNFGRSTELDAESFPFDIHSSPQLASPTATELDYIDTSPPLLQSERGNDDEYDLQASYKSAKEKFIRNWSGPSDISFYPPYGNGESERTPETITEPSDIEEKEVDPKTCTAPQHVLQTTSDASSGSRSSETSKTSMLTPTSSMALSPLKSILTLPEQDADLPPTRRKARKSFDTKRTSNTSILPSLMSLDEELPEDQPLCSVQSLCLGKFNNKSADLKLFFGDENLDDLSTHTDDHLKEWRFLFCNEPMSNDETERMVPEIFDGTFGRWKNISNRLPSQHPVLLSLTVADLPFVDKKEEEILEKFQYLSGVVLCDIMVDSRYEAPHGGVLSALNILLEAAKKEQKMRGDFTIVMVERIPAKSDLRPDLVLDIVTFASKTNDFPFHVVHGDRILDLSEPGKGAFKLFSHPLVAPALWGEESPRPALSNLNTAIADAKAAITSTLNPAPPADLLDTKSGVQKFLVQTALSVNVDDSDEGNHPKALIRIARFLQEYSEELQRRRESSSIESLQSLGDKLDKYDEIQIEEAARDLVTEKAPRNYRLKVWRPRKKTLPIHTPNPKEKQSQKKRTCRNRDKAKDRKRIDTDLNKKANQKKRRRRSRDKAKDRKTIDMNQNKKSNQKKRRRRSRDKATDQKRIDTNESSLDASPSLGQKRIGSIFDQDAYDKMITMMKKLRVNNLLRDLGKGTPTEVNEGDEEKNEERILPAVTFTQAVSDLERASKRTDHPVWKSICKEHGSNTMKDIFQRMITGLNDSEIKVWEVIRTHTLSNECCELKQM